MIIKRPIKYAIIIDRQGDCGVFDTMDDAIQLAYAASDEYSKYSLSRKNEIVDAVTKELESHLEELSLMTYKENCTSSYDDILYRNTVALSSAKSDNYFEARLATNNKTNNCENSYIVNGVIVSPSNPIEAIIKNSILMLKAGNSAVFSSNQNVKHVVAFAVKLINNAIEAVNGPKNLIVTVKEPSIENTNIMTEDERITLISTIDNHTSERIAL
ncbi:aldehyde dehydrogenase family protein [Clostridium sp.]|uniref:aldehyde dehydrogenase family protein n=1 Tax=Clostridium sp. TaxID=1506 RepID=UPI0028421114|nr:aldehyde dehydrogenase family protein [Clostridium sp.]MDR3597376.1 aldehyde dehydrogenase family protein [Clostridium sp.]